MKYVILIHSNPRPWGHPTADYVPEFQALPEEEREAMHGEFERLLGELSERGELLGGEALGDAAELRGSTAGRTGSRSPPTAPTPRPRSTSPASS